MGLRHAYTVWAPVYDLAIEAATRRIRRESLARLESPPGTRILLDGVGTGLDLPWVPAHVEVVGLDLTRAMLRRAQQRSRRRGGVTDLVRGDAHVLPFADAAFDAVVMHLILAVVPEPSAALAEAVRVTAPGGRIVILDKFLRPGRRAPLRRLVSGVTRHLATRTDVVFESVLEAVPGVELVCDEPVLGGGWFRRIELRRAPAA